jgi:hypothetical protein
MIGFINVEFDRCTIGRGEKILCEFESGLPKRSEKPIKREEYIAKISNMATKIFVTDDQLNISKFRVYSSQEFQNSLIFDQRLEDIRIH